MSTDPIARAVEVGTSRPPIESLLRSERQVLSGALGGDRSDKGRNDPEPQAEHVPPSTRVEPARVLATAGRSSRLPLIAGAGVLALLGAGGGYALRAGTSADDPRVGTSATASANATSGSKATPSTPVAAAVVARVLVPGTSTLAAGSGAATVALTAGQEVPGGSTISVSGGPAAIRFTDGSILRLDSGAAFTTDAVAGTRGSLTAGRAWGRAAGAYALTTPSGPVTAGAGSAFALDCTGGACTTFAFAGSVSGPGGTVAAGYGTIGGAVKPTNWDMTFALPFLKSSADADARVNAAFPDALGLSKRIGVRFASYAGTFVGTRTRTACTGTDCGADNLPIGDKAARTYTFAVNCAKGFPCTATGSTQYQTGNVTKTARVPMTYDGRQIRYTFRYKDTNCTDGTGSATAVFVWTFKPITAGAVKGVWAVTRTTGSAFVTNRSTSAAGCDPTNGTNTGTIDVRRKG